MENTQGTQSEESELVDPLAHLALLKRSRSAAEYEDFLNFGPWWYAPSLATIIGGMTLWLAEPVEIGFGLFESPTRIVYLLAALMSTLAVCVHWFRNRELKSKPTKNSFVLGCVAVLVTWVIIAAWGTAVSTIGYEDFVVVWAAVAWAITTTFFLVVRSGLDRIRSNRRVAAA